MIEGLKVTVKGTELRELCERHADYHSGRATKYDSNLKALERDEIEGMNYSGGDPKKAMQDRHDKHAAQADELRFIATHLVPNEDYLLDTNALARLGIVKHPFGF